MVFDQVIPLSTIEGHRFLIKFAVANNIIGFHDTVVVDVVIVLVVNGTGINNASTLFQIAKIIKDYLDCNDVVLYCYCDNIEIVRGKRHLHLSPQKYRSLLLSKMFDKRADINYINSSIIINDQINGPHHIHLISRRSNYKYVEIIEKELLKFKK